MNSSQASTEAEQVTQFFSGFASSINPDVLQELLSIQRIHAYSAQELLWKWESYTMRMHIATADLTLDQVQLFKKSLQEELELEAKRKSAASASNGVPASAKRSARREAFATPRAMGDDLFGMIEGMMPETPSARRSMGGAAIGSSGGLPTSTKRKLPTQDLRTPSAPRFTPLTKLDSSPALPGTSVPFSARDNAGELIETLNAHLLPCKSPIAPSAEPRIKITANTDLKKFSFKPMAMHLSEASGILDDRITDFQELIQTQHNLEDSVFGNAAAPSTNEIIAVGRITREYADGKLSVKSLMLETSRRSGAGRRIPLHLDESVCYEFFPGQIVGLRGKNASGAYFLVKEVLDIPLPALSASTPASIDMINNRIGVDDGEEADGSHALNIMVACGPYTADDNIDYEPLRTLCERAAETYADALILIGPLMDIEHPLLATGDFDLPDNAGVDPDKATMNDVFRVLIGRLLHDLARQVPGITIIIVPSVRDTVSKHVCWPQEALEKKVLGLPRQVRMVTNPVIISLNETTVGLSASDVLYDLRREEVMVGQPRESNLLARLSRHLIQQRHFYPLFPPGDRTARPQTGVENGVATGTPLDLSYLKLGEWLGLRPDIVITPSSMVPFAKVVESVVMTNPGSLSKRRGPGTYVQLSIHPRKLTTEERSAEQVSNHLFERTRVDIVRI